MHSFEPVDEQARLQVILHHMARADVAANYLRALLYGVGALVGTYIFQVSQQINVIALIISVAMLNGAFAFLTGSWIIQKFKAIDRSSDAKDGWLNGNKEGRSIYRLNNIGFDIFASILIFFSFWIAFVSVLLRMSNA